MEVQLEMNLLEETFIKINKYSHLTSFFEGPSPQMNLETNLVPTVSGAGILEVPGEGVLHSLACTVRRWLSV